MKKVIFLSIVISILIVVNFALAKDEPNGQPFKAIWEAINSLQEQIDNIELLPGPQGPSGPPGSEGGQLHLYDGNNQDLGVLLNMQYMQYHDGAQIYLPTLNKIIDLDISLEQFRFSDISQISWINYPELDCGGTPFVHMSVHGATSINHFMVMKAMGKYFTTIADSRATRTRLSYWTEGACRNMGDINYSPPLPTEVTSYEIEEVILPFNEPIVWPVSIVEQ